MFAKHTRRQFLQSATAVLSSAAIGSTLFCNSKHKHPNIIFLLTDDQRWDMLGCMGNEIIQTPNIDAMANDGVIFEKAFVTTAICCTSRASIFLGQYARRHGIHDFSTDFTPEQLNLSYDMQLKQAGYTVGFIGKYGVGNNLPQTSYDFWAGVPGQPTYENSDENGEYIHYTQVCKKHALEFLNSCDPEKPFCLSISFKAPHVQDGDPRQFIADPAYDNLYSDIKIPLPEKADPKYVQSMPDFKQSDNSMPRVRWQLRFSNPELYQKMVKNYYRLITGVDVVVGQIRQELQRLGYADNTVFAFMGDNGFFLGEYGFAGKWYGHEESIRVPLVWYDPRLPRQLRGQRRQEMALNIDVAPTIIDLAGLPVPADMQGKSLVPLLHNKTTAWREEFFYEHLYKVPEQWEDTVGYIPRSIGIRTKDFKYLRYIDYQPFYEELYDLQNDPKERHNLANNPLYAAQLEKLRKRCEEMSQEKR